NVERMVEALGVSRTRLGVPLDVLVIDDSSPDGTGEVADRLAADLTWMHVMHRPRKEGLGRAYRDGFAWALARRYSHVLEMDCDFSHDPAALPHLVETARSGADLVLGSRYCDGGQVANWGLGRRLISRGGCFYARALLGVGVRDLTGGFKCFRREVLEAIDLDAISTRGYAFQVDMTYRAARLGFEVVEVPIVFRERRGGGSQTGLSVVARARLPFPFLP